MLFDFMQLQNLYKCLKTLTNNSNSLLHKNSTLTIEICNSKKRAGGPILPPVVFDFAAGGFLEILEAPVVFAAGGPEILYLTLDRASSISGC